MPKKIYNETQFLTGLICPAYLKYDFNIYEKKLSQSIANQSLICCLLNLEELFTDLDFDNFIYNSILITLNKNKKNIKNIDNKRLKTYCANFILNFFKKFPPSRYFLLLNDIEIPVNIQSIEVLFYYDIILKDIKTDNIIVLNLISNLDNQLSSNLEYFSYKKGLVSNRLQDIFQDFNIKYYCYYASELKALASNYSLNISYLEIIETNKSINILMDIFVSKLKLKKNPFCLNFKCTKRKECSNDKLR